MILNNLLIIQNIINQNRENYPVAEKFTEVGNEFGIFGYLLIILAIVMVVYFIKLLLSPTQAYLLEQIKLSKLGSKFFTFIIITIAAILITYVLCQDSQIIQPGVNQTPKKATPQCPPGYEWNGYNCQK